MPPIRIVFNQLRQQRRAALIPFVMGGDPSLALLGPLLLALQDAGADLLEVGIPFSDPLADGPVIQAASARALRRGATTARVFGAIASVRSKLRVPVVCLSYWNPLMQFGPGCIRAATDSGVDGLIVPDLPVEELESLRQLAARTTLETILLAAPTSPPARLRAIARASQGFIYYVSVIGTTGMRQALPPGLAQGLRQLRLLTTKPICVGFGISTPEQVAAVSRMADGVIVGSALVNTIAKATGPRAAVRHAGIFVRRLRKGLA